MAPSQVCPSPPFVLSPEWTVRRGFWSRESWVSCMFGLVWLIIAVLLWIDHCSICAAPLLHFMYVQSHVNLSTLAVFSIWCGETTVFKTWKAVCVCFPAVYSLLLSSTHIYHQKVQGCNGWALLGVWHVAHWLHQENGWDLYFLVLFQMKERSVLLPSSFFQSNIPAWTQSLHFEVQIVACGPVWLRSPSGVHVDLIQMEGGIWTWSARSDLRLVQNEFVNPASCLFPSKNWQLLLVLCSL